MAVAVGQRPELLQPAGDRRRKPRLARDVCTDQEVAGRLRLVGAVSAAQLLDLWGGKGQWLMAMAITRSDDNAVLFK